MTTTGAMGNESYPKHTEDFEVVLLKNSANPILAKSEDFKRIKVTAGDPLEAMMSDVVVAEKGYRALFAAKPGILTEPELLARHREINIQSVDRCKI